MKTRFIAPWRSTAMSSMLSAPAHMPATRAATLAPALAPPLVGGYRQPCGGQLVQTGFGGQFHHRDQPGGTDEVRLIEGN